MIAAVIGSGGREHALVRGLLAGGGPRKVYAIPGNDGMTGAERVAIDAGEIGRIVEFCKGAQVTLAVIGPEAPLAAGLADALRAAGIATFGPGRAAARLESSKGYAKEFMLRHGIPTAKAASASTPAEAERALESMGAPVVVKADGLAAGKGVVVCRTLDEAKAAVRRMLSDKEFGAAGETVLIEEFLEGDEVSVMAFVDDRCVEPLLPSQDHKQVFDGDRGPNTGGMGAFCPFAFPSLASGDGVRRDILDRIPEALHEEGLSFRGLLYCGLMLTSDGPKVLEFNVRFGDPETQAVLPLLRADLPRLLKAVAEGKLVHVQPTWEPGAAVAVVLASGGYPGAYQTGKTIEGLDAAGQPEAAEGGVFVYHSGTRREDGVWKTAGGRVLVVAAVGDDFETAREKAYRVAGTIRFEGRHFRTDIGRRKAEV